MSSYEPIHRCGDKALGFTSAATVALNVQRLSPERWASQVKEAREATRQMGTSSGSAPGVIVPKLTQKKGKEARERRQL